MGVSEDPTRASQSLESLYGLSSILVILSIAGERDDSITTIINANSYILDINTPKPPHEIKVGCIKIKVKTCMPNPLRCFYCQRFRASRKDTLDPLSAEDATKITQNTWTVKKRHSALTAKKKSHLANFKDCEVRKRRKRYIQHEIHQKHYVYDPF